MITEVCQPALGHSWQDDKGQADESVDLSAGAHCKLVCKISLVELTEFFVNDWMRNRLTDTLSSITAGRSLVATGNPMGGDRPSGI